MSANDEYLDTIKRLEPDVCSIDAGAFYASAAISLKRIADALENPEPDAEETVEAATIINEFLGYRHDAKNAYQFMNNLAQRGFKILRKR